MFGIDLAVYKTNLVKWEMMVILPIMVFVAIIKVVLFGVDIGNKFNYTFGIWAK